MFTHCDASYIFASTPSADVKGVKADNRMLLSTRTVTKSNPSACASYQKYLIKRKNILTADQIIQIRRLKLTLCTSSEAGT
ncbi:MAG TPA: hypothetical protein PKH19_05445, partial [Candidatus Syntrophosphaera sp.]|nr:hypothetical protein [Candidatus Syntrophosphaera sp.]